MLDYCSNEQHKWCTYHRLVSVQLAHKCYIFVQLLTLRISKWCVTVISIMQKFVHHAHKTNISKQSAYVEFHHCKWFHESTWYYFVCVMILWVEQGVFHYHDYIVHYDHFLFCSQLWSLCAVMWLFTHVLWTSWSKYYII